MRSIGTRRAVLLAAVSLLAIGPASCSDTSTSTTSPERAATTAGRTASPAGAPPPGLIVYSDELRGNPQLWVVGSDGRGLHQLKELAGGQLHPSWSPDGRQIAFERDFENRAGVYVMRVDGSHLRQLSHDRFAGDPAFSPDGRSVVFSRNPSEHENGLSIVPAAGGPARKLTTNPEHGGTAGGECGCDAEAAFTPDGEHIVFKRSRNDETESALFIVGRDGHGLRRLTDWSLSAGVPRVSPDGRRLAFSTNTNESGEVANVVVMNLDGSGRAQVTHQGEGGGIFVGSWSPDGRWLSVTSDAHLAHPHIWVMRADGRGLRDLTPVANSAHSSDWGPGATGGGTG
jgi:TolB protein